jgi:hypothetical protein
LREAEALLRRAQRLPDGERAWLLVVVWELLSDLIADLGERPPGRAHPPPPAG